MEKTSKVGKPFGRNDIRTEPNNNCERISSRPTLSPFKKMVKKDVRSKRPAVIGMSCHKVIPMPTTNGVNVNKNEEIAAVLEGNSE